MSDIPLTGQPLSGDKVLETAVHSFPVPAVFRPSISGSACKAPVVFHTPWHSSPPPLHTFYPSSCPPFLTGPDNPLCFNANPPHMPALHLHHFYSKHRLSSIYNIAPEATSSLGDPSFLVIKFYLPYFKNVPGILSFFSTPTFSMPVILIKSNATQCFKQSQATDRIGGPLR